MLNRINIRLLCFLTLLLQVGCTGTTVSSSSGEAESKKINGALSIDTSSVIPVLNNGDSKILMVIHNDSDHQISGIKYTVDDNFSDVRKQVAVSGCSDIMAYSSCSLWLESAKSLRQDQYSGAMQVTARYTDHGQAYETGRVFNLQYTTSSLISGIHVNSVKLSGGSGDKVRGISYVYTNGNSGDTYWIESMTLSDAGFRITRGNLSGRWIAGGTIVPVEIEGSNLQQTAFIDMRITTHDDKPVGAASLQAILGNEKNNDALIASMTPLINAESTTSGTVYFQNVSKEAVVVDISVPDYSDMLQISPDSACKAGSRIIPGGICEVSFNVTPNIRKMIQAHIQARGDNGTSATANISWYNAIALGGAVLSIPDDYILIADDKATTEEVSVLNPGGVIVNTSPLKNPVARGGSATGAVTDIDCLAGLAAHAKCRYQASLNDNVKEPGPFPVEFNYNGQYHLADSGQDEEVTGRLLVDYQTVNLDNANIQVTTPANPFILSINGDGVEVRTATVTVSNKGKGAASLDSIYLDQAPSYLTMNSSDCKAKSPLAENASCILQLSLGPILVDDEGGEVRGKSNIIIKGNFKQSQTPLQYETRSKKLAMEAEFTAENSIGGTGSSDDPYVFDGSQDSTKKIIWTLTNIGDTVQQLNAINLKGVSAEQWSIDKADSTCYNGKDPYNPDGLLSKNLDPASMHEGKSSCQIVFVDSYGGLPGQEVSGTINDHIIFPDIMVTVGDNTEFMPPTAKPGDADEVWVKKIIGNINVQPELINQGLPSSALKLTYTMVNADNYGSVKVFATQLPKELFDYQNFSSDSGCSVSEDSADPKYIKVSCAVSSEKPASITIPLQNEYLRSGDYSFMVKFSNDATASNKTIQMNNYAANLTAKQTHGYIYLAQKNNPVSPTNSYDAVCASDPAASVLKARGYHNFKAVNLDDSSGYTDDLPDGFPLYSVSPDQTTAEEVVTRITKARSPIPGESSKALFKELFTPFENQMSGGSTNSYIYVYGNDKNVAIDGVLGAGGGKFNDCTKDASASTILYYDDHDLINFKNLGTHSLRNLSTTATGAGKLRNNSKACNYANIRVMCTAY